MAWRIEQLDKRTHDRESFTRGKPELDGYLKQIARKAAEIDTRRTWVATDRATPADATGKQALAGYYTVSMSSIDVSVIPAARRNLPAPVPTALMSSTRSMVTQRSSTSVTDSWSLPTIRCTSSYLWPRRADSSPLSRPHPPTRRIAVRRRASRTPQQTPATSLGLGDFDHAAGRTAPTRHQAPHNCSENENASSANARRRSGFLERETGFEAATLSLGKRRKHEK